MTRITEFQFGWTAALLSMAEEVRERLDKENPLDGHQIEAADYLPSECECGFTDRRDESGKWVTLHDHQKQVVHVWIMTQIL